VASARLMMRAAPRTTCPSGWISRVLPIS